MAGRKNKGNRGENSGNSSKKQDVDVEDRLQAVVLTDSFETRFMPLTAVKPRCLLPLANVPLIEYTLEFLAKAGVSEVYLICSSHANLVAEYIENSKWNLPWAPFKVATIMSPEARSVGDVMRDLDNRGMITGDFILISGDVVTNVDFNKMLEFHRKMHAQDKDHIATMCLSKANQYYKTRTNEPAAFIFEKKNNRCIYYQDLHPINSKEKPPVEIDPELLDSVDEFVIRNDLIDCRIDICTPHVPPIFQENFDYQSLRTDFVKGVISSDILGKHIYAYITDEYAVRVESWQSYDTISQDYLGRWCYPMVLESNMSDNQTYSYESGHIYKESNVILAQSCKIGKCTAIGSNSRIGEGTIIENSIIGRNCEIGENIIIKDSYIWDNAVLGNGNVITHSIVASNAKLGDNVTLEDGCIIGFDVVIEGNVIIPRDTKMSARDMKSIEDAAFGLQVGGKSDNNSETEDETELSTTEHKFSLSTNLVGANGVGYVYNSDSSDEEVDTMNGSYKISNSLAHHIEDLYLSDTSISSTKRKIKKKRTMSTSSMYTDKEDLGSSEDEEEDFAVEGLATVQRALENNHDLDTAMLELNTLRMSMNVSYHEVRMVTVTALVKRVYHFIATQTLGAKDATTKVFTLWGSLFKRQAFDEEEYVDLMNIIMDTIVDQNFERHDLILFSALNTLYDNDILEEDVIYKWWDNISDDPKYDEVKKLTSKWVEWLRTADEESSSEEEEEED